MQTEIPDEHPPTAPDILIVEDSPTQAENLRGLLASAGYRVRLAANGRLALGALAGYRPALVLSDILMPEMDGYALCTAIKGHPELRTIPVVLVTSLVDPTDIVRGLEAGADNFIRKPYTRDYLLQRIRDLLLNQNLRRAVDGPQDALALYLGGEHYRIEAQPQQILDLLVSTYEQAVAVNAELQARERQVNELNARLAQHAARLEATNREIARQNSELERANRMKSEFLANMSHELRTPLNAIIGFSDALKNGLLGELAPQQRDAAGDVLDSGRHLLSLINDILDLSKVEAGHMELELEPTDMHPFLKSAMAVVRQKAAAANIRLRLEMEALPPVQLDQRRTRQILYNLLSNAVKFTRQDGAVTLRVCRMGQAELNGVRSRAHLVGDLPGAGGDERVYLVLAVQDSGIGIAPEDMQRLFQPFVQLDGSLTRKYEGTGLGLALVRRLAEMHGGFVSVESAPGRGALFMVWLPWRAAAAGADSVRAA